MLHLHGLGHFHPENVLDNAFFEALDIGTTDEWIMSRVGIRRRRTVLPLDYIVRTKNQDLRAAEEAALHSNADTGARAARMAIERAGISPADIGMVVAGGCSPQTLIPAEASMVAAELGLEVPCFDMHSACSTFGAHLHFLAQMGTTLPDYVLAVTIENNTRVVDYRDRATCVLWGDGSAAAVVSAKHRGRGRVLASSFGGSPAGACDVMVPHVGFFNQNGAKVHKFAIKRMAALFEQCRTSLEPERAKRLIYVGHQANLTMLESVAKRCHVAEGRHWFNIDEHGNQGAAGAPAVLSQRWEDLRRGDHVGAIVVGSGLSWSSLLIELCA